MPLLYLIRHGETDWNHAGIIQGQKDPPLSETGRAQAERLRGRWSAWRAARAYVSPLRRTRETYRLMVDDRPADGLVDAFMERSMGVLEGHSMAENRDLFPEAVSRYRTELDYAPHRGESLRQFYRRVVGGFETLLPLAGDTAIVCHGGTIRMLLSYFLTGELTRLRYTIDNASVSIIEVGEEAMVHAINDIRHLDP